MVGRDVRKDDQINETVPLEDGRPGTLYPDEILTAVIEIEAIINARPPTSQQRTLKSR